MRSFGLAGIGFLCVSTLGFAAFSANAHAAPAPVTIEKLEASVNSDLILLSDVQRFRESMKLRSQLDPLFPGTKLAKEGKNASTRDIVDFLINERLIAQAFPVSDSQVDQEINSIQANNRIDRTQLKHDLKQQGFSFDQYFELIRISVSKRDLIDRDIRTKVSVSNDDIKNYFYNHYARDNRVPLEYKLRAISISLRNYKSAAGAKQVAENALHEIRSGESFASVAKRVSDDANADSGGDLGEVTEDQLSPAIRDQLKRLRIGQVSPVFGGPQAGAYFILKLVDVHSDDAGELAKMKNLIRAKLTTVQYQHQIALWLERQHQRAFIHIAGEPTFTGAPAGK